MKPIIFSTPMVRAILAGRKTQTRRVMKPQPTRLRWNNIGWLGWDDGHGYRIKEPYQIDDILWVRETWNFSPNWYLCYRADDIPEDNHGYIGDITWRPSIYMPKEVARLFLKVTNVRAERLQDITPHDAWREGCRIGNSFPWEEHIPELQQQCRDIVFKNLWDSVYAKRGYGWETNPFVWVYEFERSESEVSE